MIHTLNQIPLRENDWLLEQFEIFILPKRKQELWAQEELESGVPVSRIEDMIWEDFDDWALDYCEKMEERYHD